MGPGTKPPEADSIFYYQSMIGASEFAYLTALVRVVIIRLTNVADCINRAFHSFIRSSDSHTGRVPRGLRAHFRRTSSISNVSSNQSFTVMFYYKRRKRLCIEQRSAASIRQ